MLILVCALIIAAIFVIQRLGHLNRILVYIKRLQVERLEGINIRNKLIEEALEKKRREEEEYVLMCLARRAERDVIEQDTADRFISQIKDIIDEYKYNLVADRKKLVTKDSYGIVNMDKWIGQPLLDESMMRLQFMVGNDKWFNKGMPYFWYKVILPRIGNTGTVEDDVTIFFEKWDQYMKMYPYMIDTTTSERRERLKEKEDWYIEIGTYIENACELVLSDSHSSDIEEMSGEDYEEYCARILEVEGWVLETTPTTGDQGVDLIASIEDFRVCIQCKRYSKPVGNKAVQEVVAGMVHWNGTHAVVASNAGFTPSARKLANSTGVTLISELELPDLINRIG